MHSNYEPIWTIVAHDPDDVNETIYVSVLDVDGDPLARQRFRANDLDAPTDVAPSVTNWINHVLVDALTTERRDACADCGNVVVDGWQHAPNCDYYAV